MTTLYERWRCPTCDTALAAHVLRDRHQYDGEAGVLELATCPRCRTTRARERRGTVRGCACAGCAEARDGQRRARDERRRRIVEATMSRIGEPTVGEEFTALRRRRRAA
jgi:ssDNA-binding Zn-finger/Zn-ribbon topoisomerase 1